LIGTPVTERIEMAAPPRASPSILVRINPVSGTTSRKPLAIFTASWPIIESTTSSTSAGWTLPCMARSSSINGWSSWERPAVSRMTTV
jgi:hypothetical protein